MTFTEREEKLFEFVKHYHGDQKRKYTSEPYGVHLFSVANTVSHLGPVAVAIALCHDLVEDTECTLQIISDALDVFGYSQEEVAGIVTGVHELTDFYTKKLFPKLNRKKRKELEAIRLGKISDLAQTIKYADMADNVPPIVEFDPEFADTFVREKINILANMKGGNVILREKCQKVVNEGFDKLQSIKGGYFDQKFLKNN